MRKASLSPAPRRTGTAMKGRSFATFFSIASRWRRWWAYWCFFRLTFPHLRVWLSDDALAQAHAFEDPFHTAGSTERPSVSLKRSGIAGNPRPIHPQRFGVLGKGFF